MSFVLLKTEIHSRRSSRKNQVLNVAVLVLADFQFKPATLLWRSSTRRFGPLWIAGGFSQLVMESDSLTLARNVNGDLCCLTFAWFSCVHIFRESNPVAHCLAKTALSHPCEEQIWLRGDSSLATFSSLFDLGNKIFLHKRGKKKKEPVIQKERLKMS